MYKFEQTSLHFWWKFMINDRHKQNLTRERLIESGSIQKNNQLKHDDDDLLYTFLDLEPRTH